MFDSLRKKNTTGSDKNKAENALEDAGNNDSPKIELSLNDIDKNVMSKVQKEYLKDELDELKPMHKNDVNISPVYFDYNHGDLEVKVFIRNAFTRTINFDKIPLVISDKEGNVVARKMFDLKKLGNIEPNTGKPCKLFFEEEYILKKDFDCENLTIGFDKMLKSFESVDTKIENLPQGLDFAERNKYDVFLQKLNKLQKDSVGMSAVEINNMNNGDIAVSIIIRNGYKKDVSIENIPVTLFDKNNVIVAQGIFKSKIFKVKAISASLYRLIFKADEITNESYDISTWHVSFQCKN